MRTWSHGITLGIGLGLALAGACKDDDDNGPVDENDAPSEVAARFCAAFYGCDCDSFSMRFDSMADCETEYAESIQDQIDNGNAAMLTYQAACPGIWLDALDELGCQTVIEAGMDASVVAAVEALVECKLFYGTVGAGQPCEIDPDVSGDECEMDLVCDEDADLCAVRPVAPEPGEPCMPNGEGCANSSTCLDLDSDGESICETLPGAGETCLGMLDLCGAYLMCNQADKTCVSLPAIGEPCGPPGVIQCAEGAVCGMEGECEAAPGAGEACTFFCADGLLCQENICAVPQPLVCGFVGMGD
jgi:hypothetical protein